MKTRKELEDELARIQAELKALDDCEFKEGDECCYLADDGLIYPTSFSYNSINDYHCDWLKRGRISKDRKTLEDKDRREIIETQLLKYEVKGGGERLACILSDNLVTIQKTNAYTYGEIQMTFESAVRCLHEMNHDDLIWYLARGAV